MKKIIFVADLFAEEYVGGAELTTEALIQKTKEKFEIKKIKCSQITDEFISKNINNKFIICNFSSLTDKSKLLICKNLNYEIIEYDYKFCKYRSIEKHQRIENKPCDCSSKKESRINLAFYGYANKIWFMSGKQQEIFLENVKTIKEDRCGVLSSIFSDGDIRFMNSIKENEKNNKFLILRSQSWIKGTKEAEDFARQTNLDYELISGLPYHEMLIKLSTSKGLIFKPLGGDTCPRIVIEAKLLGCELILNENVQHKNEEWFSTQASCYKYMKSRAQLFLESL